MISVNAEGGIDAKNFNSEQGLVHVIKHTE